MKPEELKTGEEAAAALPAKTAPGSLYLNKKADPVQEEKALLRDDPLMAIMKVRTRGAHALPAVTGARGQVENDQRKSILANPVKMEDIRKRVSERRAPFVRASVHRVRASAKMQWLSRVPHARVRGRRPSC